MNHVDDDAHSFIVRIWLEPRELEGAAPKWRGVIKDVATDDQRHFTDLIDIELFISKYLEAMGVKSGKVGRLRQWLHSFLTSGH